MIFTKGKEIKRHKNTSLCKPTHQLKIYPTPHITEKLKKTI